MWVNPSARTQIGCDEGLMKAITSANIAAGFHGGDPFRSTRHRPSRKESTA